MGKEIIAENVRGKRKLISAGIAATAVFLAACTDGNCEDNSKKSTAPAFGTPAEMEAAAISLSKGYDCRIDSLVVDMNDHTNVRVVLARTAAAKAIMSKYGAAGIVRASEPAIQAYPKLEDAWLRLGDRENDAEDGGVVDYSGKQDADLDGRLYSRSFTKSGTYVVYARTEGNTLDGRTEYSVANYVPCGELTYDDRKGNWVVAEHSAPENEVTRQTEQHYSTNLDSQFTDY